MELRGRGNNVVECIFTFRSLPGVALRASTRNLPPALVSPLTTWREEGGRDTRREVCS